MSKTNREKGYYAFFNMPFAAKLLHLASRVSGWTLNGTWSFLKPCLDNPPLQEKCFRWVTLLPGTEPRAVSFNKRGSIFPATFTARPCFPNFSQLPIQETLFVYVIACGRGQLRINFTSIFKVFTKLSESRSDEGNLENFENTSEINP